MDALIFEPEFEPEFEKIDFFKFNAITHTNSQ